MRQRPKNLNLLTIRLPINAVVSILHRVSGVVLFLLLPALLWCLQRSLASEASFEALRALSDFWAVKLMLTVLYIPFFHHLYAGLRHLAQDVHWMTSLQKARFSGKVVLCLDLLTMLIIASWIW